MLTYVLSNTPLPLQWLPKFFFTIFLNSMACLPPLCLVIPHSWIFLVRTIRTTRPQIENEHTLSYTMSGRKEAYLCFFAHYQFASFLQFQCTFFYFNLLGFTYLLIMKQFHHRHQTLAQIEVDTRIQNPFPSILEKPIYIYSPHFLPACARIYCLL